MSKTRMINTRFWDDNYASNLDPIEKLMFLYFLTNTSTNISGIYEIPLKKIANETGIDKEMVIKIIDRFTKDNKIYYVNGWIGIKNFIKNQNQRSPKVKKGIEIEYMNIPKDILDKLIELGYGIDTLSHSNSNSNSNSNLNTGEQGSREQQKPKKDKKFTQQGAEVLKEFEEVDPKNKTYYANKTQRGACDFLIEEYGIEETVRIIKLLPRINKEKLYIGQVPTPFELKENWVKIGNALH